MEEFIDKIFTRHRWVVHVLFWCMVLLFYVVFFGRKNENYSITILFTGLLMPVSVGTTYFFNYFLVPRFLLKERYGLFGLYFIYTLIGSLYLEMIISYVVFIVAAELQIRSMSPASIDIFSLLASLLVVVFFGVAIKILFQWRKSKEDYQKLMLDKVEAELKFLKSQLNPHFLFNTLNNLYYLASEKSDKTPKAILALSELLDYVLHDAKVDFVLLENEIQQIKNFIALESLRYEDTLRVDLIVLGDVTQHKIAPMLLVPLVDNAFKHGVMDSASQAWINFKIECEAKRILIRIENSRVPKRGINNSGIGLENLKSQLRLLYADHHVLEIVENSNSFRVNMEIHEV